MSPRFVLDTDTAVAFLRGNNRARHRILSTPMEDLAVPAVVAGELYYGAYRSERPEHNLALLEGFLNTVPVLAPDRACLETYGRVKAELAASGRLIEDNDLFVAATALAVGATLVTGNQRHFTRVPGLELANWIQRPASSS